MSILGSLIQRYPELVFNNYAVNAILRRMGDLILKNENKSTQEISFHFINAVINVYRAKNLGAITVNSDEFAKFYEGSTPSSSWAYTLLKTYIYYMIRTTNGKCLAHDELKKNYDFYAAKNPAMKSISMEEYLGWIYLVQPTGDALTLSYLVQRDIVESNASTLKGFLGIFADIDVPLTDRDEACELLAGAMYAESIKRNNPDSESEVRQPFSMNDSIYKVASGNIEWLYSNLEYGKMDPLLQNDIVNLFISVGNVFRNPDFAENYFSDYIAQIAVVYPLEQQRMDIVNHYLPTLGDYTVIAAVDFLSEIVRTMNSKDKYMQKGEHNTVARLLEDQLRVFRQNCPDADPQTVIAFYTALTEAFGYRQTGAPQALQCILEPMVRTIWSEPDDDGGLLDLLAGMEGSYDGVDDISGNEGGGDTTPKTNGRAGATSNIHKKTKGSDSGMSTAERNIYAAYKKYKNGEEKVDSTLQKGINTIKKVITGDQRAILIEGKKFSPIGFLKKAVFTVAIFNYSKIATILFMIVKHVLKKKTKNSEKQKLLGELERELAMVEEKLQDATGDGNREAKYALMRTKMAYEEAIRRIKYGIGAEGKNTGISADSAARIHGSNATYNTTRYTG